MQFRQLLCLIPENSNLRIQARSLLNILVSKLQKVQRCSWRIWHDNITESTYYMTNIKTCGIYSLLVIHPELKCLVKWTYTFSSTDWEKVQNIVSQTLSEYQALVIELHVHIHHQDCTCLHCQGCCQLESWSHILI